MQIVHLPAILSSRVGLFRMEASFCEETMSTSATPSPSDKEAAAEVVARQPDDATFQAILRELAYAEIVRRGLADSDAGRTIPDDELRRRIHSWQT